MGINKESMSELMYVREEIYNKSQYNNFVSRYFQEDDSRFTQYYTCMYLIQDTAENIATHRKKGFTYNKTGYYLDYLELVGLLQLIYIQQDSITNLHSLFSDFKIEKKDTIHWNKIRNLRNSFIGHPSKSEFDKNIGLQYSFIGRQPIGYSHLTYENYQARNHNNSDPFSAISHPRINLGDMIDEYEKEAVNVLKKIKDNIIKEKAIANQGDNV